MRFIFSVVAATLMVPLAKGVSLRGLPLTERKEVEKRPKSKLSCYFKSSSQCSCD